MELLNLDELESVSKQVTIRGETYNVGEQTVGQMIAAINLAKAAQKDPDDPEIVLNGLRATAQRLLSDCPTDVIDGLTMRQLAALVSYASASDEEAVEGADVEVTDADGELQEKQQP